MRYQNTRYGNPEELKYYTQGLSVKIIARNLKRSEKSVKGWLEGERKIPFWVPELLRLRHMEKTIQMRQMGFGEQKAKLGLVSGNIIEFKQTRSKHHDKNNHSFNLHDDGTDGLLTRENLQMRS